MSRTITAMVVWLMVAAAFVFPATAQPSQVWEWGGDLDPKRDYSRDYRRFKPLAEQGDAVSQRIVGILYQFARVGLAQDEEEANRWYRLAADQGDAEAMQFLGTNYMLGLGVARDDAEAAEWFRKAGERGLAIGKLSLAVMYADGKGVPQNNSKMLLIVCEVVSDDNAQAMAFLGEIYAKGHGVMADKVQAYKWFSLAASRLGTHRFAKHLLARREAVVDTMTLAQEAEAEALARAWKPADGCQ